MMTVSNNTEDGIVAIADKPDSQGRMMYITIVNNPTLSNHQPKAPFWVCKAYQYGDCEEDVYEQYDEEGIDLVRDIGHYKTLTDAIAAAVNAAKG